MILGNTANQKNLLYYCRGQGVDAWPEGRNRVADFLVFSAHEAPPINRFSPFSIFGNLRAVLTLSQPQHKKTRDCFSSPFHFYNPRVSFCEIF